MTLSATQRAVLEAIPALAAARGYPPSLREVAARVGVSSTRVHQLVAVLERLGLLERTPGVARSLRVRKEAAT